MKGGNMLVKRLLARCLIILAAGMVLAAGASAEDWIVDGNNKNTTHNCHGGKAVINGNHNILTLQECPVVQINGNDNVIEALLPTNLQVWGNRNDVAWTRKSDDEKGPVISNPGTANKIHEKKQS
jgi:hypothetical protein